MSKRRALFIDRDGVINQMVEYEDGFDSPQRVEDVKLVDGVAEVIRWANENGLVVIEVSNQPGVAKGKMTMEQLEAIEGRVHQLLESEGGLVDARYICHHHPNGVIAALTMECDCRKPRPGLINRASVEMGIDVNRSIMLGDKASDVAAAAAAGCQAIIFIHEMDTPAKVVEAKKTASEYRAQSMGEVWESLKDWVLKST